MSLRANVIGITMGDPAGIGPEVIAKALKNPSIAKLAHFCIIGDLAVYKKYTSALPRNASFIDLKKFPVKLLNRHRLTREGGYASLAYLNKAIDLLKAKKIRGLVTGPVCKEGIQKFQKDFTGHTDYLAHAFGVKKFGMLFVAENLRTILVTRHIPLAKVRKAVTRQSVHATIMLTHQALKKYFKIPRPNIAVCGLNPHAGQGGVLGDDEIRHIIPAIKRAKAKGIKVSGPYPADTAFRKTFAKNFDCFVAMYHDQGLIPIKTLYFDRLVDFTIGLPFVRTSPAHGTAFDIAGKNKANPGSMMEAIKMAARL